MPQSGPDASNLRRVLAKGAHVVILELFTANNRTMHLHDTNSLSPIAIGKFVDGYSRRRLIRSVAIKTVLQFAYNVVMDVLYNDSSRSVILYRKFADNVVIVFANSVHVVIF